MTFKNLQSHISLYAPALYVDDIASVMLRRRISMGLTVVCILLLALFFATVFVPIRELVTYQGVMIGVFLMSLSLRLAFISIAFFYNAYYFKDVMTILKEYRVKGSRMPLTYTVAKIIHHTEPHDVTDGLLRSPFGREVLLRLGISSRDAQEFLDSRTSKVEGDVLVFPESMQITAPLYAQAVFGADAEFSQFLFALTIQEKEFMGTVGWVNEGTVRRKHSERRWSKDSLGRVPGIGKGWAFGSIAVLKNYAEEFTFGVQPSESGVIKEVEELEAVLARTEGANALILSPSGSGEMDVVYGLVGMIQSGTVLPPLEGKRLFRLDANALVEGFRDRSHFESHMYQILNEAVQSGNIILVLPDLPNFVQSFAGVGSDIASLLEPYLASSRIQIIATSDQSRFHDVIESNTTLVNAFEVVRVTEKNETALISVLEHMVPAIEATEGVFFTYQALDAVAESTVRYFSESSAVDKAKDLLLEIPTTVRRNNRVWVTRDDVLALVELKSGVPQEGRVSGGEKEKLLELEKILHSRVVGQDEAIDTIANAMRRARAGLSNPSRPIGSFLFLGPTGVGKTETAKALAEVFFGATSPMLRLDMSEYSGSDAVLRLIGSFEGGRAGTLSTMLRDQKYGVLLLDEFEKTTPEVMNLFLQILDEGFFSDMHGKKVNARNVIVIATSNAGSEIIFKSVQEGKNLALEKNALIDSVIASGQFKPELLNRFDGVILFHPLDDAQLKQIAKLMAEKLGKQLKVQGINLKVTDDLVAFLAREGSDKKFGARPMNRVLQERVEKLLADKLIRGEIRKGATIEFMASRESPGELEVRTL